MTGAWSIGRGGETSRTCLDRVGIRSGRQATRHRCERFAVSPRTRSSLLLGSTLAIGVVLGVFLGGAVQQFRFGTIQGLGDRRGFVRHMERIIDPRDEQQRQAIRPILEATAERNHDIDRESRQQLRAALYAMIASLSEHLDDDQRRRLEDFARRPPRRGPPGGPPPPPR